MHAHATKPVPAGLAASPTADRRPARSPPIQRHPDPSAPHARLGPALRLQRHCACSGAGECEACARAGWAGVQARLAVNEPGDAFEQEAHRVADQVLAAPAPLSPRGAGPSIQRWPGPLAGAAGAAPASVDRVLDAPGAPLEPGPRRDMEGRFGLDFSAVRVHTDADAAQSARDVHALAYTAGHHIAFAAGRFAPETAAGRRLLAHELTHVVQQSGPALPLGRSRSVQRDIDVESGEVLPSARVVRDDKDPGRLLIRYGDEVVATLTIRGADAGADRVQVRDRTGARNEGRRITAIDLDIVHPPGVTVTVEPSRPALARTAKQYGIGDVLAQQVEARPPFGKDELQLWPPLSYTWTIKQRRPMNPAEKAESDRYFAEKQAREIEETRQLADLRRDFNTLRGVLTQSEKTLDDLWGAGIIILFMNLPDPTVWNDVEKELSLAERDINNRYPGGARVRLRKAQEHIRSLNKRIWDEVRGGLDDMKAAERQVGKWGHIIAQVGETVARMIPGPIGKALVLAYEVLKPPPKSLEEVVDRLDPSILESGGHGPTTEHAGPAAPHEGAAHTPASRARAPGVADELAAAEQALARERQAAAARAKGGGLRPADKARAGSRYDYEVTVKNDQGETHTYSHEATEGTWCRFSEVAWCGHALGAEADHAVAEARQARRPSASGKPTERYVGQFLGGDFRAQQRFFEGKKGRNQLGMSITDYFSNSGRSAIVTEVKNISIEHESAQGFADLREQTGKYLSNVPKPAETRFWLFLDVRGQELTRPMEDIARDVQHQTGNVYDHVFFITEIGVIVY